MLQRQWDVRIFSQVYDSNAEPNARPNDEERGHGPVPSRAPSARSSSLVSFALGEYSMSTTRLFITFASLLVTYSLLLLVCYRPLTRPEGVRLSQSTTPVETTTAEELSRGESSFTIRQECRFGTTRKSYFLLAMLGYIALSVGFAIAFVVASRSAHA